MKPTITLLTCMILQGCSTAIIRSNGDNYGTLLPAVKGDVYLMSTMDEYCTGFNKGLGYTIAFVDLPFSIVSDLVFSPIDSVIYLVKDQKQTQ